jgi:hypothetical protein
VSTVNTHLRYATMRSQTGEDGYFNLVLLLVKIVFFVLGPDITNYRP